MDTSIENKVKNFFKMSKIQNYREGEILIRAEDDPSGIFYLNEGIVKEYAISKKGDEIVVNIFKPKSFFPMSWAINNTKNLYYYEAITPVEVYLMSKKEVINFIKDNLDVLYDLLSRVYNGTDGIVTRMVYLMSESAYDRLILELIIHAKRFGKTINDITYIVKTSERDLAGRAGMTRETISREFKKLKEKNLVIFGKNKLTIPNLKELENELSTSI